jgi:hypothetical protein
VRRGFASGHFGRDVTVLSAAMLLVLGAHLIQIAVRVVVLEWCGAFSSFTPAFYHSAVN